MPFAEQPNSFWFTLGLCMAFSLLCLATHIDTTEEIQYEQTIENYYG